MSKLPQNLFRARLAFALLGTVLWLVFLASGIDSTRAQDAVWELGSQRFLTTGRAAKPLSVRSTKIGGLSSYRFVARVGGVDFELVAEPADNLRGKSIELEYRPGQPDGKRLYVLIDGASFAAELPDWQLKPIALFADSGDTGVVSLFGEGDDPENYYYIDYHPAYQDTLLGMRLLQADIMLMNLAEFWQLPRWGGRLYQAAGERVSDQESALRAARQIAKILDSGEYRSWVLTDSRTTTGFSVDGDRFRINSNPYFYFWQTDQEEVDAYQLAVQEFNEDLRLSQAEGNKLIDEYNSLIEEYKSALEDYNEKVDEYNSLMKQGKSNEASLLEVSLESGKNSIEAMEPRIESLKSMIDTYESRIEVADSLVSAKEPEVMMTFVVTTELQKRPDLLEQFNPAVYHAYLRTAGYAAFFRYVKEAAPEAWRRFKDQIAFIEAGPPLRTPTSMPKHQ